MSHNNRQNRRREPKLSQIDRQGWKSLFLVLARIVLICALAIGIPYGIYLYYLHLVEKDYFVPTSILVHGNLRVDDDAIREASGLLNEDANLFELDVHTIEASIETLPWVKNAKVRIDLPNQVDIAIEEHQPLGIVNAGQLYVVDKDGLEIKPWTSDDDLMDPIVSLDVPLATHPKTVIRAFELGDLLTRMGFPDKIQEIHYDDATGFSIFTDTTEIRLGYDRFDERIARLLIVHDILEKRDVVAEYVLLDADTTLDRIVVKPAPRAVVEKTSDTSAPLEIQQPATDSPSNAGNGDTT